MYLDAIPRDRESAAQWKGKKLDPTVFEKVKFINDIQVMSNLTIAKMSSEQIGQLYELMHATKEVWKSPQELERQAVDGVENERTS